MAITVSPINLEQEIQQWDGALPSVYGASDPLPVLDMTDSLANDTAE